MIDVRGAAGPARRVRDRRMARAALAGAAGGAVADRGGKEKGTRRDGRRPGGGGTPVRRRERPPIRRECTDEHEMPFSRERVRGCGDTVPSAAPQRRAAIGWRSSRHRSRGSLRSLAGPRRNGRARGRRVAIRASTQTARGRSVASDLGKQHRCSTWRSSATPRPRRSRSTTPRPRRRASPPRLLPASSPPPRARSLAGPPRVSDPGTSAGRRVSPRCFTRFVMAI